MRAQLNTQAADQKKVLLRIEQEKKIQQFAFDKLKKKRTLNKSKNEKALFDYLRKMAKLEAEKTKRMEELEKLGGMNKLQKMTAALVIKPQCADQMTVMILTILL